MQELNRPKKDTAEWLREHVFPHPGRNTSYLSKIKQKYGKTVS